MSPDDHRAGGKACRDVSEFMELRKKYLICDEQGHHYNILAATTLAGCSTARKAQRTTGTETDVPATVDRTTSLRLLNLTSQIFLRTFQAVDYTTTSHWIFDRRFRQDNL
jgi:hypothetical protein